MQDHSLGIGVTALALTFPALPLLCLALYAKCEKPFLGHRHCEKKGLAYCETHYNQVRPGAEGGLAGSARVQIWKEGCLPLSVAEGFWRACREVCWVGCYVENRRSEQEILQADHPGICCGADTPSAVSWAALPALVFSFEKCSMA